MHAQLRPKGLISPLLLFFLTTNLPFIATITIPEQDRPSPTAIEPVTHFVKKPEPQPTNINVATTLSKRQLPPEALKGLMQSYGGEDVSSIRSATKSSEAQHNNNTLAKKVDVPPSFFYNEKGLLVRCHTRHFVYNQKPFLDPHFPNFELRHWVDWKAKGSFEKMDSVIRVRQTRCYTCGCTDEGAIVPSGHEYCTGERTVARCILVFDNIPATVRNHNRNFRYEFNGESLGFDPDTLGPPLPMLMQEHRKQLWQPVLPGQYDNRRAPGRLKQPKPDQRIPPLPPLQWYEPPWVPGDEFQPLPFDWGENEPVPGVAWHDRGFEFSMYDGVPDENGYDYDRIRPDPKKPPPPKPRPTE
ncbi:hypothetical protein TWF106_006511 [Orbilia oligospora]|uniref:Uncharacterized protein n=1 Tax=Orbilia oligospora TaxID=2813651 RepID=A0A6G1MJK6_ORBOL|nr:hypothetical protein TWF106_006511 [Orbilia oligospora]KAF3223375.1 hypothetical protein TWF191_006388 [Orbilia oligospora]KAF3260987.1 hypothetical protein TWF192_008921 [Orbilia oligospora]